MPPISTIVQFQDIVSSIFVEHTRLSSWTAIKVSNLTIRTSKSYQDPWACVQIGTISQGPLTYDVSALDVHITIGSWCKSPLGQESKWFRAVTKANKKLTTLPSLEFEIVQNVSASTQGHIVYTLMEMSPGGDGLNTLSQIITNSSELKPLLGCRRAMRGHLLFHISVYQNDDALHSCCAP